MSPILHLDYETRSDLDLRKTGLHIYARGKNTDVWCASYAFDEEPVQLWTPDKPVPKRIIEHVDYGGEVWAHNAPFEVEITNNVVAPRYGFPTISYEQVICTMSMAYAMGLPGSLEGCAAALGLAEQKDMSGSRLMIQMSKPREILPDGTIIWWDEEEKRNTLYRYCIQDTVVERSAGKRMLRLSPYERRVWILDQIINCRGITVDTKALFNALTIVENEKERLNARMKEVTSNQIGTFTAVQQIKDFVQYYGINAESLDKPSIIEFLKDPKIHPLAKQVIEIRQEGGKAATSKFEPMLTGAGSDSRVRGCFQYSGANTRRWAGRRIQLHNLKRPSMKHKLIEEIMTNIQNGMTAENIHMIYGSPLSILAECVRSFLMSAPGHELLTCDFNAIEARVVAWLAGQENVLEVFRKNLDIYKVQAGEIFNVRDLATITDIQRQVGKVAILALGYGGGVGAFQQMAAGYNVQMAPVFDYLFSIARPEQRIRASETWKKNGKKYEISREEFIASDLTKIFWREANPQIVEYWGQVEAAAIAATVTPGSVHFAGNPATPNRRVKYRKNGSFLWCQLPGSGVICYPYPEIRQVKTPWGEKKDALTYMAEDGQSKKWLRFSTYGGSLVENLTQSVARDLLADSMLRVEYDLKYPIVGHVHDEIICEKPLTTGTLENLSKEMTKNPRWAHDLPIAAGGWVGNRYRK